MSDALEGSAHPDPEAIHAPPKRTRPNRRRWISFLLVLFPLIQLLSFLGVFAPVFSPLVYAKLAPPDWHNATPHGRIILTGFAVSVDEPGLMFACGWLETLGWPQPWSLGSTRYWRSTDGGTNWQLFQPPFQTYSLPFQDKQYCTLAAPPGGHGVVLATLSKSGDPSGPGTVWMSHDAGNSWRQVESGPGDYAMYRNGVVYDTTNVGGSDTFSASTDDGATWTALEPSPDPLVRDGWRVDSTVPDYRSEQWWYRDLAHADAIPVLEHSQDNGRTWSVVGPIGASAGGGPMLATTPMAPGRLCAGKISLQTKTVVLLAGGDSGRSWRTGTMPPALQRAQGETTLNVAMGDAGECYEGFHYGLGQEPASGNSYFGYVSLARDSAMLDYMPLTDDGNNLDLSFTLVPAGHGMSARLVTGLDGRYPGWAPVFSGLAGETTDDGQIVWHGVP